MPRGYSSYREFTVPSKSKLVLLGIKDHHTQAIDIINNNLIPAFCRNRNCSDKERQLLYLPVKMLGMGLVDKTSSHKPLLESFLTSMSDQQ